MNRNNEKNIVTTTQTGILLQENIEKRFLFYELMHMSFQVTELFIVSLRDQPQPQ